MCHCAAASGQPPGRLSLGHRHVSLRRLSEVCPSRLQLRGSHLESGALFPLRFVSDSHVPCVLVLPLEYSIGFFGRFFSYSWALFLVRQWIHVLHQYWAFGRIAHIFYVAADSNPDCVSSPFGLNGEECPVDASGCIFAPRSSHLEYWTFSRAPRC